MSLVYSGRAVLPRKPQRRVGAYQMSATARQRYRDLEVVRLRDQLHMTWLAIAATVERSQRQCQRRYKIAKGHL